MATVPHNIYIHVPSGRFLDNAIGPIYGNSLLAPFIDGDTWPVRLFLTGDYDLASQQFPIIRYQGATVTARLRAQGNDTIYATANGTEIVPLDPSAGTVQAGDDNLVERQVVWFDSEQGSIRLTFSLPTDPANDPLDTVAYEVAGTTLDIPAGADAAEILNLIHSGLMFYRHANGAYYGGPYRVNEIEEYAHLRITTWVKYKGFGIEFGTLNNGTNPYVFPIPLVAIDATKRRPSYGWDVPLVLDGNGEDFADLFDPSNGPAYFEVVLTPSGGNPQLFQTRISADGAYLVSDTVFNPSLLNRPLNPVAPT